MIVRESGSKGVRIQRVRTTIGLNMLLTLMLASIGITPYLSRNFSNVAYLLIFILWIVSALLANQFRIRFSMHDSVVWWTVAYIFLQLFMRVVGHSNLSWKIYINRLPVLAIPVMMLFILKKYNQNEKKRLLCGLSIIIIINLLSNFLYINNRELFDQVYVVGSQAWGSNVGGTTFVCVCMFWSAACLVLVIHTKHFFQRMTYALCFFVTVYYLLAVNQRAIALVLMIVMLIGIVYVSYKGEKKVDYFLRIIVAIVLVCIIYHFMIPILETVRSMFSSQRMLDRLDALISFLNGNSLFDGGQSSFEKRIQLAKVSIDTFTHSGTTILFGVGEQNHGDSINELIQYGVGNHSELLDCLAMFGIFGGIVYGLVFSILRLICSLPKNVMLKREAIVMASVFTVYAFVNKILSADILYMICMVFPLVLQKIDNENL